MTMPPISPLAKTGKCPKIRVQKHVKIVQWALKNTDRIPLGDEI